MIVVVTGGRDYKDLGKVLSALGALVASRPGGGVTIYHGGAPGADTLAGVAAKILGIPVQIFPADWKRYGKVAGPIRNAMMVNKAIAKARSSGQVAFVLAFPGGRGTESCVAIARHAGLGVSYAVPTEPRP